MVDSIVTLEGNIVGVHFGRFGGLGDRPVLPARLQTGSGPSEVMEESDTASPVHLVRWTHHTSARIGCTDNGTACFGHILRCHLTLLWP